MPPVCRPGAGEIDVTTPAGLEGDVEVTVQAAGDPGNAASIMLHFASRAIPRPYHKCIDGQRLRERRLKLGLSQKAVADRIGDSQTHISQIENEKWKNAPDDIYIRLAEVYGAPLSHFLRSRT